MRLFLVTNGGDVTPRPHASVSINGAQATRRCKQRMALMELSLISASAAVGEPADCDLVFHLEEVRDMPDFSLVHPWAGKTISALRDR